MTTPAGPPSGQSVEIPAPAAPIHVASGELGITAGAARARQLTSLISRNGAVAVLVVLLIIGSIFDKGFGSFDNLQNVALGATYIGIISAGMTFVIISGGIDLSVGSMFALAVLTSAFMSKHGSLIAIVVPLVCCAGLGMLQGLVIARWRLPAFIVTLAGLTGIRGIVYYITKEGNTVPKVPAHTSFLTLGQGKLFNITWPIWITLIVFAIGWWLLNRTAFGQAVQTIGGSRPAAELMGLPVRRIQTLVYVISGLCAGFAGILTTASSSGGQEARIGDSYELVAIAAVVIGGTLLSGGVGSMVGTLAGIAIWFVISNLVVHGLQFNTYIQQVVSGGVLLLVVVLQTLLSKRVSAAAAKR